MSKSIFLSFLIISKWKLYLYFVYLHLLHLTIYIFWLVILMFFWYDAHVTYSRYFFKSSLSEFFYQKIHCIVNIFTGIAASELLFSSTQPPVGVYWINGTSAIEIFTTKKRHAFWQLSSILFSLKSFKNTHATDKIFINAYTTTTTFFFCLALDN